LACLEGHTADRAERLRLERTVELEPVHQRQRPPGGVRIGAGLHQEDGQLGCRQVVIGLSGQEGFVDRDRSLAVAERCLAPGLPEEQLRVVLEPGQPLLANLERLARSIELEVQRRQISVGPRRAGQRRERPLCSRLRPGGLVGLEVDPGGDRQRVLEPGVRVHQRHQPVSGGERTILA
jgi:hypothetical protein